MLSRPRKSAVKATTRQDVRSREERSEASAGGKRPKVDFGDTNIKLRGREQCSIRGPRHHCAPRMEYKSPRDSEDWFGRYGRYRGPGCLLRDSHGGLGVSNWYRGTP
jgi:hypothetical protein